MGEMGDLLKNRIQIVKFNQSIDKDREKDQETTSNTADIQFNTCKTS